MGEPWLSCQGFCLIPVSAKSLNTPSVIVFFAAAVVQAPPLGYNRRAEHLGQA